MGSTWGLKSTIVGTVYADFVTRSPYKSHHVATHGRNGAGKLAEGCPCCSAVRAQAPRRDNLVKQDPRFPVPRVHFPRQQIYLFYWTHVGIAGVSGGTPCEQPTEPQTHCAPSVDVGLKNDAGRLNTIGTAIGPLIFAAGRTYWGRLAHTTTAWPSTHVIAMEAVLTPSPCCPPRSFNQILYIFSVLPLISSALCFFLLKKPKLPPRATTIYANKGVIAPPTHTPPQAFPSLARPQCCHRHTEH